MSGGSVGVCVACRERQLAWLGSKPSAVFRELRFASNAAYDDTVAGVVDGARYRHQRWVALVREQMAGIAADCRAARHVQLSRMQPSTMLAVAA